LRFYKKLITLLEKQGRSKLNAVATELDISENDLLEKLCYYSKFQSFELDGDDIGLRPNRNITFVNLMAFGFLLFFGIIIVKFLSALSKLKNGKNYLSKFR